MNGTTNAVACPKCGGPTWDNRTTKKNPAAPDYKCRDRSCDGVIWPPKQNGRAPVQQAPKQTAPASAYVGDLPGDPAPAPARSPEFAALCERYLECARFVAGIKIPATDDPQAFASMVAAIFIERNKRNV